MPSHDIVQRTSPYAFADTVGRLLAAFDEKGITVFATIDQQAEARAVGLSMPPTTLIVFGNPRAGTPLMLANPQAGLDLPLKVLVCEPAPGRVDVRALLGLATAASAPAGSRVPGAMRICTSTWPPTAASTPKSAKASTKAGRAGEASGELGCMQYAVGAGLSSTGQRF